MKRNINILVLTLLTLGVSLTSCKKDKISVSELWAHGGLWKIIESKTRLIIPEYPDGVETCYNCGYLKFGKNGEADIILEEGNTIHTIYNYTVTGGGKKLIFNYVADDGGFEYKIKYKNKTLILTSDEKKGNIRTIQRLKLKRE